jgi:hypothetical protein
MSETTSGPPSPTQAVVTAATTAETAILNAPEGSEPSWAKPVIAILALVIFAALIVYAHITNNAGDMQMLDGGAMAMAGTAVSYYLGSSSGSDRKTKLLATAPSTQNTGVK